MDNLRSLLTAFLVLWTYQFQPLARKGLTGTLEVWVETTYSTDGIPNAIRVETVMRRDELLFTSAVVPSRTVVTRYNRKTGIEEDWVKGSKEYVAASVKSVSSRSVIPSLKYVRGARRQILGYNCIAEKRREGRLEFTHWLRVDHPEDLIASSVAERGKIRFTRCRLELRAATDSDEKQFSIPANAQKRIVSETDAAHVFGSTLIEYNWLARQ